MTTYTFTLKWSIDVNALLPMLLIALRSMFLLVYFCSPVFAKESLKYAISNALDTGRSPYSRYKILAPFSVLRVQVP